MEAEKARLNAIRKALADHEASLERDRRQFTEHARTATER
jgi:hypothetical protein